MKASKFPRSYRAYCFDDKKMYYPKDLIKLGMSLSPDGLPSFTKEPHFSIVLMWNTGQLDKNQKEIHESDICKVKIKNEFGSVTEDYAVMRYNQSTNQFILHVPMPYGGQLMEITEAELIGNEFENPELIPLITHPEEANG